MDRETYEKHAPSCVVPVVVVTSEAFIQVGTAFSVSSSGIWITARHVLEGRLGAIEYGQGNPGSHLAVLWLGPDEDSRTPIRVTSFTRHPASGSDLAVLWTGATDIRFPALRLSALIPPLDTPVVALGYPKFECGVAEDGQERVEPKLTVTVGKVTEVYIHGKDKFRDLDGRITGDLPTVSYQTTARAEFAMSGGPVLDPSGSVCGVIAKGFDRIVSDEPDTSFASATPYIFMLNVAYSEHNKVSIYDLAKRRIVATDDSFGCLRMTEADDQLRVFYSDP
jgi:S1-C subfamily serine protease